jgi:hypothetical protein
MVEDWKMPKEKRKGFFSRIGNTLKRNKGTVIVNIGH